MMVWEVDRVLELPTALLVFKKGLGMKQNGINIAEHTEQNGKYLHIS